MDGSTFVFSARSTRSVLLLVLCNLTLDFGENSESLESSDFKVIGSGLQEELSKCTMSFAVGKRKYTISQLSGSFSESSICSSNI